MQQPTNPMQKEEWEDNLNKWICRFIDNGEDMDMYWQNSLLEFIRTQISQAKSQERQRIVEKVKVMQTGWYDAGEGLDVEFSAQEMKDDIIIALTEQR